MEDVDLEVDILLLLEMLDMFDLVVPSAVLVNNLNVSGCGEKSACGSEGVLRGVSVMS